MVWDFTYTINFTNIVRDWIVTICLFVFLCWFVQYLWHLYHFLNVCHFEWKLRNLSSQQCSLKTTEKKDYNNSVSGLFNILKNDMVVHILHWENWRWSHCAFLLITMYLRHPSFCSQNILLFLNLLGIIDE